MQTCKICGCKFLSKKKAFPAAACYNGECKKEMARRRARDQHNGYYKNHPKPEKVCGKDTTDRSGLRAWRKYMEKNPTIFWCLFRGAPMEKALELMRPVLHTER